MQGTVNEMGRSQRGTPKLKIDGTWYVASRLNLDGIQTGTQVDFEPGSFPTDDGKQIKCINKIRPLGPPSNGYGPSKDKVNPAVSDDAEMRFISNCVGQAILAGAIKAPADIHQWFSAAKAALKAPTSKADPEFDDDIPY